MYATKTCTHEQTKMNKQTNRHARARAQTRTHYFVTILGKDYACDIYLYLWQDYKHPGTNNNLTKLR